MLVTLTAFEKGRYAVDYRRGQYRRRRVVLPGVGDRLRLKLGRLGTLLWASKGFEAGELGSQCQWRL